MLMGPKPANALSGKVLCAKFIGATRRLLNPLSLGAELGHPPAETLPRLPERTVCDRNAIAHLPWPLLARIARTHNTAPVICSIWLGPALSPNAHLRHLLHQHSQLLELPEEPLDVLRQDASTGGDAAAPGVIEDVRAVPLLPGHRVDQALDAPEALLCVFASGGPVIPSPRARQHITPWPQLLQLLELPAKVFEGSVRTRSGPDGRPGSAHGREPNQ